MQRSTNRILTPHVGSLARPRGMLDLLFAKERGEKFDGDIFETSVTDAVGAIVKQQVECGIDVVCDGEQSKSSFLTYIVERLKGFSPSDKQGEDLWVESRETIAFPEFYDAHRKTREGIVAQPVKLVCTAPVEHDGHAVLQRDIANVKADAEKSRVTIAIENHSSNLINTPDSMKWLAELAPSNRLGIALAPYHLESLGVDAGGHAKLIKALGNRIAMFYAWQHGMGCHKKLPKEQELLQMPGRGKLDFTPIVRALKQINYNGFTSIFMHPVPRGIPILKDAPDCTTEINRARTYLEKCLVKA